MSFSTGDVRFTRYEFPYNGSLDPTISYTGTFAITRDKERKTLIHKVYSLIQYILNILFNIKIETDYNHGMIVIRKSELQGGKQDELIIAHVTGRGIRTKRVNYLNYAGNDATSLVVYVPKDDRLRSLLSKYGEQTAYVPEKHHLASADVANDKKPGRLSIWKISTHWLKKPELSPTPPKDDQRIALSVADLLMGRQFLNQKGTTQEAYYCMDYATTVLQSAILIRGLEEEVSLEKFTKDDRGILLTRGLLAEKIHQKLIKKGDNLHTLFTKNPIMPMLQLLFPVSSQNKWISS
jgi:hypothetical protein